MSAHSFMIKYGLPRAPTKEAISLWRVRYNQYLTDGMSGEEAGEKAAKLTFSGYQTHHYASAADSIEMLLMQLDD